MSSRTSLVGFCVLAYGLTWMCWLPIGFASAGRVELPFSAELLATLGQFGPLASAVLFSALDGHGGGVRGLWGRFLLWRVSPVWFGVVLLLPPACLWSAIFAHALAEGNPSEPPALGDPSTLLPHLVITLLVGGPLGEEPGWRGFALPRLRAAWHPVPASVLLGLIWAGWHLPLWWIADVPASFGLYVVGVIPLTYLFTWVSDHTQGSVLLAMLFHASLNTSLARLRVQPAWVEWTAVLWLVALAVGIIAWGRGRRSASGRGEQRGGSS
ncbi:MAG: CPBP family intramembrane metalloprotease [Gemmataceae bacterium]|nr:CPBP family intramembrane metalloprotease [Gemmataceae bacterium]